MYDKLMRALLILLSVFCLQGVLVACNTMEGMGEDIEAVGEEIDEEAEEKRAY